MDQSNSAKIIATKAPQFAELDTPARTASSLSPVDRHLGLIKAMAIIMAVLIFAALAVIFVTVYGRLAVKESARTVQENELFIPVDSHVTSASLSETGHMLLILEDITGQQLWQIDPAGKVRRKTTIKRSP